MAKRPPKRRVEPHFDEARGSRSRKPTSRAPRKKQQKKSLLVWPFSKNSRKKTFRSSQRSLTARLFYIMMVCSVWVGIGLSVYLLYNVTQLPSLSDLKVPERAPNIIIVDTLGKTLTTRGSRADVVSIAQLPSYVPDAVIAIEDRRFYRHFGLDPIGFARAMVANLKARRFVQGGSTLTQQLAKNLFLSPERSINRKVQELLLAFWLEARFSKSEIMDLYLNRVYFGAGAYGIEAAAQRYYQRPARLLSVSQAATLAGLLKAPSRYAPTRDPELARTRASVVLNAMVEAGYLSEKERDLALSESIKPVPPSLVTSSIQYAADWVMDRLPDFIGQIETDIIVETTIDRGLQEEASRALKAHILAASRKNKVSNGAVVSIDSIGAIRALVGGIDYERSGYNRAVVAKRQPGSSFKPFVYLTALEQGYSPKSIIEDKPIRIGKWSPQNYSKSYLGPVTLDVALAKSLNTVAVQLAQNVGVSRVARTAQRLGILSELQHNASLALGTSEVNLLELTTAYVPFANGGAGVIPYMIKSIKEKSGKPLYVRRGQGPGRVVRSDRVAMMNFMLRSAVEIGTAKRARLDPWVSAGKTGTTQNSRDALFVGYTSNLVTGVWVGNDNNSPMKGVVGSGLPVTIWHDVMAYAHQGRPPQPLLGTGSSDIFNTDHPQTSGQPLELEGPNGVPLKPPPTQPNQNGCDLTRDFFGCMFGR